MAGNDNSFEKQMLDFYGVKKTTNILLDWLNRSFNEKLNVSEMANLSIFCDVAQKYSEISKSDLEKEKNKLKIELYNQLEIDRQNGK